LLAYRQNAWMVRIDREETVALDRTTLPEDAEFRGHEDVVVQGIVFGIDNALLHKEKSCSPGESKTCLVPLPVGYEGSSGRDSWRGWLVGAMAPLLRGAHHGPVAPPRRAAGPRASAPHPAWSGLGARRGET
jgi:hypothetical protein